MLSGHTKTHVVIAIAGIVAIAVRSTHIPRVVVPRPTTQHPLRAHSTYAAPLACTAPLLRRQWAGFARARYSSERYSQVAHGVWWTAGRCRARDGWQGSGLARLRRRCCCEPEWGENEASFFLLGSGNCAIAASRRRRVPRHRLRRQTGSWTSGHTKTHVAVANVRSASVAARSTYIPRVVAPRATTQNPLRALSISHWVT